MTDERFGSLRVIKLIGSDKHSKRIWQCHCDCGNVVIVPTGDLRSGHTKSCGCLKVSRMRTHGMHNTRTYRIWRAMLNRSRQQQYAKYYSEISVCERWTRFEDFLEDMGDAPDGLSIDRIDNSLGYSPSNCRWATQKQQTRNTRRRKEYELNGKRMSLIEWSEHLGVSHELLRGRVRRGWRFQDAVRI